jgi:pyruvate/2-oxoglutarate/acetoin dehydrogenase E1 component
MADVAGGGFAVGAALAGRRPMYIIRYQGFNWYNSPMIANYACKSKEIWGVPCPMFVRSIAMEGGIGPVAGSSHHSIYYRMPGIKIVSPMTPGEYRTIYEEFMNSDDVVYVSEHRGAYNNTEELEDFMPENPKIILFPISITRFAAMKAAKQLTSEGISVAVHHVKQIKPFTPSYHSLNVLAYTGKGIVLDDDYVDGIAKNLAWDLNRATGSLVDVMGLQNKTAGFYPQVDNLPPDENQIIYRIRQLLS